MAEISASIVSYGGYEEVVQAAASILRYTSQPVDLYIIDNASPDGTGIRRILERGDDADFLSTTRCCPA